MGRAVFQPQVPQGIAHWARRLEAGRETGQIDPGQDFGGAVVDSGDPTGHRGRLAARPVVGADGLPGGQQLQTDLVPRVELQLISIALWKQAADRTVGQIGRAVEPALHNSVLSLGELRQEGRILYSQGVQAVIHLLRRLNQMEKAPSAGCLRVRALQGDLTDRILNGLPQGGSRRNHQVVIVSAIGLQHPEPPQRNHSLADAAVPQANQVSMALFRNRAVVFYHVDNRRA